MIMTPKRCTMVLSAALLVVAAVGRAAQPATMVVPVPADTSWTLDRCQAVARLSSPKLASGRATADAARADAKAAAAGRLPTLGLTGRAAYTTKTMSLNIPTLLGTRSIEFGDGSNTDLMLGARVPLYEGGALSAEHQAAEDRWQASLAEVATDSLGLQLQVRQTFYAALGSEAAADAARQGETRLRRHLTEVEQNLTAGTATEEARLQVLARLRHAEQTTVQAEAAAASRRYVLGRLVGQPGVQIAPQADLEGSLLVGGEASRPWDQWPQLLAMDARRNAVHHSARAAAGSLLPGVDLEGGWHYGKPGVDQVTNEWMEYGTVAVTLRWTLFDFGSRRDRVMSLRAQGRAIAASRDDVQGALEARQADARTQLESARTLVARASDRLDLERRLLDLAHERWQQGHATENELLDAQDDMTLAASDLALAQAQLRLAEAELLAALGW